MSDIEIKETIEQQYIDEMLSEENTINLEKIYKAYEDVGGSQEELIKKALSKLMKKNFSRINSGMIGYPTL